MTDDPRAYIAADRRRALARGTSIPDRVDGSALFADISGFTPLTEALVDELGAQRGPEELVTHLDRLFTGVIDDLHAFDGSVLYFSGDAITCWLDGDDGSRAVAAALAMQRTFEDIGRITTREGRTVDLAIKVAVAVGQARRFIVGDPDIQLHDVLAGNLIDDLAAAEGFAEKGDVIADGSVLDRIGDRLTITEIRREGDQRVGVVTALAGEVDEDRRAGGFEQLPDTIIRQWLLPTVYERLSAGGGLFAELRTVCPMFIRFGGIDFDSDDTAIDTLDAFIRASQEVFSRFGGNLLQITLGDKGAYLYGVFGSPRAHEDDAERAVRAALDMQGLEDSTGVVDIQIGVSTGMVFSATQGHPMRRTFACTGDPTNLAARLMGKAPAGQIYVSAETKARTDDRFAWDALEPLTLKGKSAPVSAFTPGAARRRSVQRHLRFPLPIVGRDQELAALDDHLASVAGGSRRIVGIAAEPGIGKSRLVAEAVRRFRAAGHRVAFGEAQAFGRTTSYLTWREPWSVLLDIEGRERDEQIGVIERILSQIQPGHVERAPLFGTLLGIEIADTDVTSTFDAKLRKTSLENLAADVLRHVAIRRPSVIVLEDAHWIDEASLDLLEVLARETEGLPVLFIVAYRTEIDDDARQRIEALSGFHELRLEELGPEQVEHVITAKLEQQFGSAITAAPDVMDLVVERGQGNPFYIEELINFLRRRDIDITVPGVTSTIELPPSLHSLVLSRVDALDEAPRRTLKVASVVGREFELGGLPSIYPDLGSRVEIVEHLEALWQADLITQDRKGDDSWIFRHAVTRDVAYESIPFSTRAELHEATGTYLERDATTIETSLDLLAHHYWHSENRPKKIVYQRRAGEAAKASYANTAAIEYFERLSGLVEETERSAVLLDLGQVLEVVGEWSRAEAVETEAFDLAVEAGDRSAAAWCEVALAEVTRKQGRYDETASLLDRARTAFDAADDPAGTGRVLHLLGTLNAQRGDLDTARETYEDSLAIRQRLGDQAGMAGVLSNLGIVAEYSGDLDGSRRYHERALDARKEIGDRWAIAVSVSNLGMIGILQERFEEARDQFAEAMRLAAEVGDSWVLAVNHNNIGNAYRGLHDVEKAKHHYAASADAYITYGDRWSASFLLEDVAVLAARHGDAIPGIELLGAADAIREDIDAPRATSLEADLLQRVVGWDESLSEPDRRRARERGHRLGFREGLAAAIAYCRESR